MRNPLVAPLLAATLGASAALAQQAVVVQECFVELAEQGVTARQASPVGAVFHPGYGFDLRLEHPAGATVGGLGCDLQIERNHVRLSSSGGTYLVPSLVTGRSSGSVLVTLPPGRGLVQLLGEAKASGGPGVGLCSIAVDVGDDGTTEMNVYPYTYHWVGRASVFVDGRQPSRIRITLNGVLWSTMMDHFFSGLDIRFLPDTCPDLQYGNSCWPLIAEQGPGYLDFELGPTPSLLVYGLQPLDLPIPGSPCRQLLSPDIVVGITAGTFRQPLGPLPPGLRVYAQVAQLLGNQVVTSNGVALICPP